MVLLAATTVGDIGLVYLSLIVLFNTGPFPFAFPLWLFTFAYGYLYVELLWKLLRILLTKS
jgi:hypothetical protein